MFNDWLDFTSIVYRKHNPIRIPYKSVALFTNCSAPFRIRMCPSTLPFTCFARQIIITKFLRIQPCLSVISTWFFKHLSSYFSTITIRYCRHQFLKGNFTANFLYRYDINIIIIHYVCDFLKIFSTVLTFFMKRRIITKLFYIKRCYFI